VKLLAIDIGASSGRALQGELSGETLSFSEVHRFKNEPTEKDGHKHWDVERLRSEIVTGLTKADRDIETVGIDTWGVDYGYIDGDGDLMAAPFAYRDDRTRTAVDRAHQRIPFRRLYEIAGIQFMPINTIYQMVDDAESRPELVARADRALMMPELLAYMLTGEYAAEYSIASTSGLLDARRRDWSDEILGALELPRRLFGDISPPGGFTAELSPDVASASDCRARLVLPACHDTASAVAATPLDGPGSMYISSGTWSLAGLELDRAVLGDEARDANFTNEGGVGGTIRFLKNVMGLWIIQECRRVWAEAGDEKDFGEICGEAAKARPFAALFNVDNERFLAPENMPAEIRAECERTGQPPPEGVGATARCVFECLALAYRVCLEQLEALTGRRIERIHVVGGGVQNKLLCQMTASACGVPVLAGPVEATAIGSLLVQGVALGAISDIEAARRVVRATFAPDEYMPRDGAEWQAARRRYAELTD
jgi:sugar (pentulose or hexulose) kinase